MTANGNTINEPAIKQSSHWKTCKSLSNQLESCSLMKISQMFMLNEDEFIVLPYWTSSQEPHIPIASDLDKIGIFKYNILTNKWSLYMKYTQQFSATYNCDSTNICHDPTTNKIYASSMNKTLTTIDLNNKTYHPQKPDVIPYQDPEEPVDDPPVMTMVNDERHIITKNHAFRQYTHFSRKTGTEMKVCTEIRHGGWYFGHIYLHKLFHLKSQNKLILFIYHWANFRNIATIWYHQLGTKGWEAWKRMPGGDELAMGGSGIIITSDEKYCIIFGQYYPSQEYAEITIVNLETFKYETSMINTPEIDGKVPDYEALLVTQKCDYALICGFFRICIGEKNVNLPVDILNLICI